ncbi:MAG: hypothetical protein GY698_03715 [Actinomycetia bacterium]|nr:hypothetical protein [Actinomycetes bacterium]
MSGSLKRLIAVVMFSLVLGLLITWCSGEEHDDSAPATTTSTTTTIAPTTTAAPATTTSTMATTSTTMAPTTTTSSTTTTMPAPRLLSILQLTVGDCVVDELSAAEDIAQVGVVSCSQPHQSEVYAVLTDPAPDAVPWPGPEALIEASASGCLAEFEPYVGQTFEESALDVLTVLPTAETWPEGDRDILCIATRLDGRDLDATVRDSGL